MKVRKIKGRPFTLTVTRHGAWGVVTYVMKRAYFWGHHCPMSSADSQMTARVTAYGEQEPPWESELAEDRPYPPY